MNKKQRISTQNPVYLRPTLKEILHNRVGTVHHLGKRITVFVDDHELQYYFYYEGNRVNCGERNDNYGDFIKGYLDSKINFICLIDTPEYPLMLATLEYRKDKRGRTVKCLILSDREKGLAQESFYVGEKRASNESCIKRAKYLISIIACQNKMDEAFDKNTTEGLH